MHTVVYKSVIIILLLLQSFSRIAVSQKSGQ